MRRLLGISGLGLIVLLAAVVIAATIPIAPDDATIDVGFSVFLLAIAFPTFSARMRDAIDLPTLTHDLDATVREAIAPSRVGLWLRGSDR